MLLYKSLGPKTTAIKDLVSCFPRNQDFLFKKNLEARETL